MESRYTQARASANVLADDEQLRASVLDKVRGVLRAEANAVSDVADAVGPEYLAAIDALLATKGKVVVTGMGKSGLVGRKIAATMSSTGTLAVFLHPAEAAHGDLGIVGRDDVVLALSKSGESEELNAILPVIRRIGAKIIAITSNASSTLAKSADVVLQAPVLEEACPHNLAPTTSTTVALAIGDALAMALMRLKAFEPQDFALYHPGGALGRRLLLTVSDLMVPIKECAVLDLGTASIKDVVVGLTSHGLGIVVFLDREGRLAGIVTDGDVRRLLEKAGDRFFALPLSALVNLAPVVVQSDAMAVEVLRMMEDRARPLNVVPVLSGDRCVGVVRLHDLVKVT